jgi:hypothetical protein
MECTLNINGGDSYCNTRSLFQKLADLSRGVSETFSFTGMCPLYSQSHISPYRVQF